MFGGSVAEDSPGSDTDLRYMGKSGSQDMNYLTNQDEDLRRINNQEGRSSSMNHGDEDLRFGGSASGPGRPGINEFDVRNPYGDRDFRHLGATMGFKSSMDSGDTFGDMERDSRSKSWDDDKAIGGSSDGSRNNFDKRDIMSNVNIPLGLGNIPGAQMGSNHHNMQNISPNMPPTMPIVPHPSINQLSAMQNKNNTNMMPGNMGDGQIPPHLMHMPPNFGPNGPPMLPNVSGGFGPNFRPPNPNFGPNQHFRPNPMAPFAPNQGPGPFNNNFSAPPNFRCPTPGNQGPPPNFDRSGYGPNFRNQMQNNQPGGGPNGGGSFNAGFGKNYGNGSSANNNKNGPNRGINRNSNDNNRNNYNNNRGRGRDNDQGRGSRLRDNY